MRKLLTTTAVIAFAAATPLTAEMAKFGVETSGEELSASELIGMRVYANEKNDDANIGTNDDWTDVGEINDILVSADGSVEAVLVDIGGFLGLGERQISMDMSSINMVNEENSDDFFLVINTSRAALEEAPAYETEDMAAMKTDMEEGAETVEAEADEAVAEAGEGAESLEAETEEAIAEVEEGANELANETEEVVAEAEENVEGMANETEETVAEAADGAEAAVTDTEMAASTDTATPASRISPDGYNFAARDELTTEELTGTRVYDADDEWIGEISAITVTDNGDLDQVVIDVGGFLGLGEKPVALPMSELEIVRETDTTGLRVYTSNTEAELEAMPTYEN